MKKAISLALSAAMTLSSLAALQLTGIAADDSISFGGEREFDAVRITYADNAAAPEGTKLTVNGTDYPLTAGENSQVVNVPEDTKASEIQLAGYGDSKPEVKLLEYDRIEMTTKAESSTQPYSKPYLAASWHFATGDQKNSGNCTDGTGWRYRDDIAAVRYEGLFDGNFTTSGNVEHSKTRVALGYDGYKEINMNFNFLKATEIAKIEFYNQAGDSYINNWYIGIPKLGLTSNGDKYDEIDTTQKVISVTAEDIKSSPAVTDLKWSDNTGDKDPERAYKVDKPINITSDKLQVSIRAIDQHINYIYELLFYTYKDVYTVGETTYTLNLENAPEAFNAVRLTYDAPQSFTGTSQFLDAQGNEIGAPQPINFNGTTNGAAVLDTDTIATKTAAAVKITVPDGVGMPTASKYLKYKRIPLLTQSEAQSIGNKQNYHKPYLDTCWQIKVIDNPTNTNRSDYQNRDDVLSGRYPGLFDGIFDEKTGEITNLEASNVFIYFDEHERTVLNYNFLTNTEIAKASLIMRTGNNISGYEIGIPSYNETVKGYVDLNNPIIDRSYADIESSPKKTFSGLSGQNQPENVSAYELNEPVNTTAQMLQISFDDPKLDRKTQAPSVALPEIAFYTYEEITPETPAPKPASYNNTYVKTITPDNDTSIQAGTSATAVLSTIESNDEEISVIKWTWNGITRESTTKISPNSTAIFGLILSDNIDENADFNNLIKVEFTPVTTIE